MFLSKTPTRFVTVRYGLIVEGSTAIPHVILGYTLCESTRTRHAYTTGSCRCHRIRFLSTYYKASRRLDNTGNLYSAGNRLAGTCATANGLKDGCTHDAPRAAIMHYTAAATTEARVAGQANERIAWSRSQFSIYGCILIYK